MRAQTGGNIRRTAVFLAFALAATPALAGGLSKYKKWDKTPEAYFMTNTERAQWKTIKTDAEAEKFVQEYKARRGAEFEKTLAARVEAADRYFSVGSTKGSETLRGKVIIVFGPPSAVDQGRGGTAATTFDPSSQGPSGGRKGGNLTSGGASAAGSAPTAQTRVLVPTMRFIYDAEHAPKAIGHAFTAEVNMISTSYQEPKDAGDLDAKFEAVAEASTDREPPAKEPAPAH